MLGCTPDADLYVSLFMKISIVLTFLLFLQRLVIIATSAAIVLIQDVRLSEAVLLTNSYPSGPSSLGFDPVEHPSKEFLSSTICTFGHNICPFCEEVTGAILSQFTTLSKPWHHWPVVFCGAKFTTRVHAMCCNAFSIGRLASQKLFNVRISIILSEADMIRLCTVKGRSQKQLREPIVVPVNRLSRS